MALVLLGSIGMSDALWPAAIYRLDAQGVDLVETPVGCAVRAARVGAENIARVDLHAGQIRIPLADVVNYAQNLPNADWHPNREEILRSMGLISAGGHCCLLFLVHFTSRCINNGQRRHKCRALSCLYSPEISA